MSASGADRRAAWLLGLGAAAGVALAALGVVRSGTAPAEAPAGAVAVVNGQAISREGLAEIVGAVAAERKSLELDASERRRLLDRMIDEELLLQRGLDLGLARYERTARRAIVAAVIAAVTADAEAQEPGEDALRAFHRDTAERFQRPGRVRVDVLFVGVSPRPEAIAYQQSADAARRARAGEDFATLQKELGERSPTPIPAEPVSIDEVRATLGPSAAAALQRLEPGAISDPVRGAAGWLVLRLRERAAPEPLPYEQVREQVRAEYLRSVGERALVEYLEGLRSAADVRVVDAELAGS
jgi:parvulin-like peptidyl-prolyl isomerase